MSRAQLEDDLTSLVLKHAAWLNADAWDRACEAVAARHFDDYMTGADFVRALTDGLRAKLTLDL